MQMQWSELKELLQLKEAVPGPLTSGLPWGGHRNIYLIYLVLVHSQDLLPWKIRLLKEGSAGPWRYIHGIISCP